MFLRFTLFVVSLLIATASSAQIVGGSINGAVLDPAGAVVPGAAQVTIHNQEDRRRASSHHGPRRALCRTLHAGRHLQHLGRAWGFRAIVIAGSTASNGKGPTGLHIVNGRNRVAIGIALEQLHRTRRSRAGSGIRVIKLVLIEGGSHAREIAAEFFFGAYEGWHYF